MHQYIKNILIVSMLATNGCASIVSGGSQVMLIKSVPDSAALEITNKAGEKIHTGTTPATVSLKRSSGFFKPEQYQITVSKEGFPTKQVIVEGKLNGWYLGNVIFGGLIGLLIVDPMTGAMYTLKPEANAALPVDKDQHSLTIVLADNVPASVMQDAKLVGNMQ